MTFQFGHSLSSFIVSLYKKKDNLSSKKETEILIRNLRDCTDIFVYWIKLFKPVNSNLDMVRKKVVLNSINLFALVS